VLEQRKCTHLYHYYMHQDFGLMHVRVKSWFPFTVSICLNGRNWLARQMDRAGIDVLRFLGKNRPEVFCGELTGTLKHRAEGLRLKHTVNGNSLKIYDKEAQVLRVETTINRPRDFRVYRPTLDDPNRGLKWQETPLRGG
jgi:hypothetical protein